MGSWLLIASIPLLTTNPNNGSTGNTRVAGIIKAQKRKAQRKTVRDMLAMAGPRCPGIISFGSLENVKEALRSGAHLTITVTRIAPSNGLDPHDGLGAALKSVIDGVTDAIGLKNDRNPLLTWVTAQRRGPPKHYSVEIQIETRVLDT